jgi:hypothetical protein
MQSPDAIPLVTPPELDRLASALRGLPQVGPAQSSWERIAPLLQSAAVAQEARPHRRNASRWIPLAAAASVAVVSGWLGIAQWDRLAQPAIDRSPVVARALPAARDAEPVQSAAQAALIERSGSLERWLVESGSAQWPQDLGSASASVEIENLIANVDQRLTRSSSVAERDQLWQRRVGLLEQLVTLQGEPMALSVPDSSGTLLL